MYRWSLHLPGRAEKKAARHGRGQRDRQGGPGLVGGTTSTALGIGRRTRSTGVAFRPGSAVRPSDPSPARSEHAGVGRVAIQLLQEQFVRLEVESCYEMFLEVVWRQGLEGKESADSGGEWWMWKVHSFLTEGHVQV